MGLSYKHALMIFLLLMIYRGYAQGVDSEPSLQIGASVFKSHCALCHGSQGMGEGILPIKLSEYPNTNLRTNSKFLTRKEVLEVTTLGGRLNGVSEFMPPMGQELSWTEMESVVDFIIYLRQDPKSALNMVATLPSAAASNASLKEGKNVYSARCTLCHGVNGEGDGRMSKIIKDPPPANLVSSLMPEAYLTSIITNGGGNIGRSPQMPPWGEQLSKAEIASVVKYIMSLRP